MHTKQELRNLTDTELASELKKAEQGLHAIRIAVKTKQEKAHNKLKEAKKYIARIETIATEAAAEKAEQQEQK